VKGLTYGQRLVFQSEYWNYLTSEKCDCSEQRHVFCHSEMIKALDRLERWDLSTMHQHPKIIERMVAFKVHTSNAELKRFAEKVIERIKFIETHRMDCSVRKPRVKKVEPALSLVRSAA
jgi:hypothetical protein